MQTLLRQQALKQAKHYANLLLISIRPIEERGITAVPSSRLPNEPTYVLPIELGEGHVLPNVDWLTK